MVFKKSTFYKFLAIAAVFGLFIYSVIYSLTSNRKNPPAVLPAPKGTMSLPSSSGEPVVVRDFTRNPVEANGDNFVIEKTDQFTIGYYQPDQTFQIALLSQPVKLARQAAEQALLKNLGLSQEQACGLKVSLGVPFSVDNNLAGQDYGLSFCPSGRPF